jgi:hypothetical protein
MISHVAWSVTPASSLRSERWEWSGKRLQKQKREEGGLDKVRSHAPPFRRRGVHGEAIGLHFLSLKIRQLLPLVSSD